MSEAATPPAEDAQRDDRPSDRHSSDDHASDNRKAAPEGRDHQAFPVLTDEQLERIKPFGKVETLEAGTAVFQRGQTHADLYVLLSGCIEIFDFNCQGEPQVFTTHEDSQFTGEIDLFSDRKVLVSGRIGEDAEVIRVPNERFRELMAAEPEIADVMLRAFIVRRIGILESNLGGSWLVGRHNDPDTLRIQQFLQRNGYPVRTVYVEDDSHARDALEQNDCTEEDLPVLLCHGEKPFRNPSLIEAARGVGIAETPDSDAYDVAVIGAGPGGMAAAVYAASEGLKVVVLERQAPGGQAGTSSKIENYLGFPNGLSGQELAGRAQIQAQKFGARLALPMAVSKIDGERPPYTVHTDACEPITCRSIVIASGATYRTLSLNGYEAFEGRGIYYAATAIEAGLCEGEEVIVIGGGNSAGQAAVYMSRNARHVHVLVRGDSLADSMSDYLLKRLEASRDITLHFNTEVTDLRGNGSLESVTWENSATDEREDHDIRHIFSMIGAVPNTGWLNGSVLTDENGFVCTGVDVLENERWPLDEGERRPGTFETSLPGVFAVGDVRAGSVKRCASAVGEGSVCVQAVHRVVSDLRDAETSA